MEAEERWWQRAGREFKAGWRQAGGQHVWLLRWMMPLVLTAVMLNSLVLKHEVPSEDVRIIIASSILLLVGWYCGYQIGRHDRDGI